MASTADNLASKYRSPNCKASQSPTSLFTFFANNKDDASHEYQSFMLSCQPHNHHTPDSDTLARMKELSASVLSSQHDTQIASTQVHVDAHGINLGAQGTSAIAAQVSKRRMANNCGPSYDLSNVTAHNRFTCRYLGKGVDDEGKEVENPFQTWKGTLASCDDTFKISDEVESDIRHLAWSAAHGEEAKLDVSKFMCSIQSIPIQ